MADENARAAADHQQGVTRIARGGTPLTPPRGAFESESISHPANTNPAQLARRLGLFDGTMLVMGGIIGSGIFMNPHVVAEVVHTPELILGAWAVGGLIALAGAFIYAELAALRPQVGGQYAYIREAIHPLAAFIYGWTLLLVVQSGGMAAVAVTFARYFLDLTHVGLPDWIVAAIALAALTIVNCFGVRAGSTVQSVLMMLKILAIVALIGFGLSVSSQPSNVSAENATRFDLGLVTAFGAAMVPVLFAFGGWQTASFVAGEMRDPQKNLPRALLIGVVGVIILYLAVNFVCIHALGTTGLASTKTPASEVMSLALGDRGRRLIAIGIAISTLGFLSQGMLTAPRVYFAMADDGLFFKRVASLHPRSRVPAVAIGLQGALAIIIAMSGRYEQILNYVVSVDSIFFGLTAACLFALRKCSACESTGYARRVNPVVIMLFIIAEWLVAASAIYKDPRNTLIGVAILIAGIPVYYFWKASGKRE